MLGNSTTAMSPVVLQYTGGNVLIFYSGEERGEERERVKDVELSWVIGQVGPELGRQ